MHDLAQVLAHLSETRPVFHSEADFQHSLAWELRSLWPQYKVRLEYSAISLGKRRHIDILASDERNKVGVELKYKTSRLTHVTSDAETFGLLNQGAQDQGRYDFLKDVERLEAMVKAEEATTGHAVLLTNDQSYWTTRKNPSTVDSNFALHDGRVVSGILAWSGGTPGTTKSREVPIRLSREYHLRWQDYSELGPGRNNRFRYLVVQVGA